MVKRLAAVLTNGMPEVEAARAQALGEGGRSADVVLDILARRSDPGPAATIMTPGQPASCLYAGRRLRPLRRLEECRIMERAEVLDMMGPSSSTA
jgi:hypothetical protein